MDAVCQGMEVQGRVVNLSHLYELHAPHAKRLAYLLCGSEDLADELVQEAFVRVAGRLEHLRHPDAFYAYLRQTIVNLLRVNARSSGREDLTPDPSAAGQVSADASTEIVSREAVMSLLGTLPPRQRAALILRYYEDFSTEQVAAVLDCSNGTARSLLSRGLARLRVDVGTDPEEWR